MKHWVTNQEIGEGFQYDEEEHEKFQYNTLLKPEKHERNLMRTYYLIKDVWNTQQLESLKIFIDEQISERKEA
mgnify:CR=1 FL=1